MADPNILDQESLYNVIVLGGVTSPGNVVLSGHDRKSVWDVSFGPFLNGAVTRLKGIPPIEFTATFSLLRDLSQGIDDFANWPAFRKLINSTVSTQNVPHALDIYHPALAANDIKQVCRASMGGEVYDKKGGMVVQVKFQEYRLPKPWGGTPAVKPKVDPNADIKAQIQRLTTQYQNTPAG